jgi:CRISPR-associated protein (Cas_Cmr5)
VKRLSDGLAVDAFAVLTQVNNDKEREELRSVARTLPVRLRQNGLNGLMLALEAGKGSANPLVTEALRKHLLLDVGFPVATGAPYEQKTLQAECFLRFLKLAVEADHNQRSLTLKTHVKVEGDGPDARE